MAVIREHLQTLVTGSNDRFGIMSVDIMGKLYGANARKRLIYVD